jgi:hypothetical protein
MTTVFAKYMRGELKCFARLEIAFIVLSVLLEITRFAILGDSGNGECCICFRMYNEKGAQITVVKPCNHSVMCFECASRLDKCPICRTPMEAILHGPRVTEALVVFSLIKSSKNRLAACLRS